VRWRKIDSEKNERLRAFLNRGVGTMWSSRTPPCYLRVGNSRLLASLSHALFAAR
jgi:hypothetical protein